MAIGRIISAQPLSEAEETFNVSLRPKSLKECIGQQNVREKLAIAIAAAKQRGEPLEHMLFYGPPGLGKTTLANVVAIEMGARIRSSSGPALVKAGDVMGLLTNINVGDVLFIDEIHRLSTPVEEFIYPAMEDFRVDFTVDSGLHAKTINFPLKRFTLIGATTRAGLLSAPLRSRFGMLYHLDFYTDGRADGNPQPVRPVVEADLRRRHARTDRGPVPRARPASPTGCSSGSATTPRSRARAPSSMEIVDNALKMEQIDALGLDELDRSFLRALATVYNGGPAGIEALAATLGEERDTLEDVVEPYLLQIGFVRRTKRGREITPQACEHLGLEPACQSPRSRPGLFEQST